MQRYRAKEEIIRPIEKETGKNLEEIKTQKGGLRQLTMDVLYRIGGIKGVEIGRIFDVHYSTVSQGRKRLLEKLQKDRKLRELLDCVEKGLSLCLSL
ncbi:MAG: hypothetical protein HY754_13270 [Nitrospirae bacterium]|nr:hypothetical protein [Nitrospirota bacterium]